MKTPSTPRPLTKLSSSEVGSGTAAPAPAEIGWNQPDPITLPAGFSFTVLDSDSNDQATISSTILTPDQFNATTVIDQPFSVAHFNAILSRGNNTVRRAYISNDEQIIAPPFGFAPFDAIWFPDSDPNDGFHATAYVPNLGGETFESGLKGYWLTSVKQVVTPTGQTVYFYGNLIPEPSGLVLMLLGCVAPITRAF